MSIHFLDQTRASGYREGEKNVSLSDLPDGWQANIRPGLLVATKEGTDGGCLLVKRGKPLVCVGGERPLASLPVSCGALKNALTAVSSDKGSVWRWFHRVDINVNEGLRKFLGVKGEAPAGKRRLDLELAAKLQFLGAEFRALLFSLLCRGRLSPDDAREFVDIFIRRDEQGKLARITPDSASIGRYVPPELQQRLLAQKNLPPWFKASINTVLHPPSPLLEDWQPEAPVVDENDPLLGVVPAAPLKPMAAKVVKEKPRADIADLDPLPASDFWSEGPEWMQHVIYERPLRWIHDKIGPTTGKVAAMASLCGLPGLIVGFALGAVLGGICALVTFIVSGGNKRMAARMFEIICNSTACIMKMLFVAGPMMLLVAGIGSIGLLFPKEK